MTVRARVLLVLAMSTGWASLSPQVLAATTTEAAPSKAQRLDALYERFWEENLALHPIQATLLGDPRYRTQLPDHYSAGYRAQEHAFNARWLQTVEAMGAAGLEGQDLLSYEIFVRNMKRALEAEAFPDWMQPVHQFGNFLVRDAVQLGSGSCVR